MKTKKDFPRTIQYWQAEAIRLDPDGDIQDYFSDQYSYLHLINLAGYQSKRFVEAIVADADACARCQEEFDWENQKERAWITQFEEYAGEPIPDDEKNFLFLDADSLSETVVCESCMRIMVRRYQALQCCAMAAMLRQALKKTA